MPLHPLTYDGRLPGVAVQPAPEIMRQDPLRMDVAGFVGFAERGPLDLPVMVEDISQYWAIFGGDMFIARNQGRPVYAQLPRAVQAFFDNGGRRCYVVRVANEKARANRFRVPGLVHWSHTGGLTAVICPAACEGRWSDDVRIATRLHTRSLIVDRPWNAETREWFAAGKLQIKLRVPSARTVQAGDLIAVTFDDDGETRLFARVSEVKQTSHPNAEYTAEYTSQRSLPVTVYSEPDAMAAFTTKRALPPLKRLKAIDYVSIDSGKAVWNTLPVQQLREAAEPDLTSGNPVYLFEFRGGVGFLPKTGSVQLRLEYDDGLVVVLPVTGLRAHSSGDPRRQRIECATLRLSTDSLDKVEVLTERGWSERRIGRPLSDLAFTPGAATFPYRVEFPQGDPQLGAEDVLRFTYRNGRAFLFVVASVDVAYGEDRAARLVVHGRALWEEITFDRELNKFPSLDEAAPKSVELHTFDLLVREGRETFEAWRGLRLARGDRPESPFWEDVLARPPEPRTPFVTARDQLGRSTRLARPECDPQRLPAFYFPLDMNERALLPEQYEAALPADDDHPSAHDGLDTFNAASLFLDKSFIIEIKSNKDHEANPKTASNDEYDEDRNDNHEKDGDDSEDRSLTTLSPEGVLATANEKFYFGNPPQRLKKLHSLFMVDEVALIAVPDLGHRLIGCRPSYNPIAPPLPKSDDPFQLCEPATKRPHARSALSLRRAYVHPGDTELALYQRLAALPEMESTLEPCETLDDVLLVHRAMLHLAAARGDILAVLSLPYRFGYWDVLEWRRLLTEEMVEPSALSYGAAFHGWMLVREETTPQLLRTRTIPPDGAICGMIAARELARGPGVAPANEALHGVVGLDAIYDGTPELEELFNRQINVLQTRPGKFLTLSAYTLSRERQFLQISVRRMVMFLRRLVMYEGQRFVFEPNNERFRRAVQVRFERLFDRLLEGGSLLAYQVDATDRLNTPDEVDRGRFIIAIRVALAYPIEYITIVLLRTGESLLEIVER